MRFLLIILVSSFFGQLSAQSSSSLIKQTGFRQYSTEQGLSQNGVTDIFQDSNGFVWISTNAGLNRLDGNHIENLDGPKQILDSNTIIKVLQDRDGAIWVATFDGIVQLDADLKSGQIYQLPSISNKKYESNFALDLIEKDQGNYWLVSWEGLFILSPVANEITAIPSMKLLFEENAKIRHVAQRGEYLWLVTNKGLYRFNTKTLMTDKIELEARLAADSLRLIYFLTDTTALVATEDQLAHLKFSEPKTKAEIKHIVELNSISGIVSSHNKLFISAEDALYSYDPNLLSLTHLYSLSEVLPRYTNYTITKLFVDYQDKLWIGTESQGAFVWDPQALEFKSINSMTKNPHLQLSDSTVWAISQETDSQFWIGTDKGLNFLDLERGSLVKHLQPANDLSDEQAQIFDIEKMSGTLWLATADGLISYEPKSKQHTIFRPNFESKKTELFIYAIAQTPEQDIWLATDIGPLKFNTKTQLFSYEEELMSSDRSEISSLVRYADGVLWFGFRNKLIRYNYHNKSKSTIVEVEHKTKSSEIFLTDFYIDEDKVWSAFSGEGIYITKLGPVKSETVKHFVPRQGFVDSIIFSLLPDDNSLWASSHSGLIEINKSDFSYDVYDYFRGLPSNEFNEGASLKSTDGQLIFGGTNGVLFFNPERLQSKKNLSPPQITSIQFQGRRLIANALSWSQRNLMFSPDDQFIQFSISSMDFLTPNRWVYKYWITGAITSEPESVRENKITLAQLPEGEYTLHIQTFDLSHKNNSAVTSITFDVESDSGLPLITQVWLYTASLAVILLLSYWWYRAKRQRNQLQLQVNELQVKVGLMLYDKKVGVWEWRRAGEELFNSQVKITLDTDDTMELKLGQYSKLIHPDDLEIVKQDWNKFLSGESTEFQVSIRVHFYDDWVWTKIVGHVLLSDEEGKVLEAGGSWNDITAKKKSIEELNIYKNAIESTRDIVIITDRNFNIVLANQSFEVKTGFDKEQLIGHNIFTLSRRSFSTIMATSIKNKLELDNTWRGEIAMPRKDKTTYLAKANMDPIPSESEIKHYIIVIADISRLAAVKQQDNTAGINTTTDHLPNKVLAFNHLAYVIDNASKVNSEVGVAYISISNFRFLSESLDENSLTALINNFSRYVTSLLGTDERLIPYEQSSFLLVFDRLDNVEKMIFKIDKIINSLPGNELKENATIPLAMCAGISCYPKDGESPDELLANSLKALKHAKRLEKNPVHYFSKSLQHRAVDKLAMKSALESGLNNEQIFLVFQPKFELNSQSPLGFEVLLRWRTSDDMIIYPSQFLPIAIETGLIEPLTEQLINKAFYLAKLWRSEGLEPRLAINLIPKHCVNIGCQKFLADKMAEYEIKPKDLRVEINESCLFDEPKLVAEYFQQLESLGLKITIDDFGQGSFPVSNLQELPVDAVKFARKYTKAIHLDGAERAILSTYVQLANKLNITTTAKGIETKEQLEKLQQLGIKIGQGYYFSDPLSEIDARQFLIDHG